MKTDIPNVLVKCLNLEMTSLNTITCQRQTLDYQYHQLNTKKQPPECLWFCINHLYDREKLIKCVFK